MTPRSGVGRTPSRGRYRSGGRRDADHDDERGREIHVRTLTHEGGTRRDRAARPPPQLCPPQRIDALRAVLLSGVAVALALVLLLI
jgi:hypothetical protein